MGTSTLDSINLINRDVHSCPGLDCGPLPCKTDRSAVSDTMLGPGEVDICPFAFEERWDTWGG